MVKDPVCGMEFSEEKARHIIYAGNETFYFCSKLCRESYARQPVVKKSAAKKGAFSRFLQKLARENENSYGGKPPKCH